MSPSSLRSFLTGLCSWLSEQWRRGLIPSGPLMIVLASLTGVMAGCGAVLFTLLIDVISGITVRPIYQLTLQHGGWLAVLCMVPISGLLLVAWFTRRFAPEAQGHGVPEVILSVARYDGIIRPRASLVKILASGVCIGTGGSVGLQGPTVQIGSALGSLAGQLFSLSPRHIRVLVAAGAAAGISAAFNAPISGVVFASEIILGSFAVESLTPIVIASVLANVVQLSVGDSGMSRAFPHLHYLYQGSWAELPSYLTLGVFCGLAAVGFTKLLYAIEDLCKRVCPTWWIRALLCGGTVALIGVLYPVSPPVKSTETPHERLIPPLFGVGYDVVEHALHLERDTVSIATAKSSSQDRSGQLDKQKLLTELWWLLPLVLLKPLLTSLTLSGGGSGGIFAPSLFIGATLGASFGIVCNLLIPGMSASPGVYAVVGMGAVVAGTTHGLLSAILIVYELTDNYYLILPIMAAAGFSSLIAKVIDSESIYLKKLNRRGDSIARGHQLHQLEHIHVREVMIREFPTVRRSDDAREIIRIARANSHIECLPVMDQDGRLVGIIRPEDLHRVLDSDVSPHLVNAEDIASSFPLSVSPDANLLEALSDFGMRDLETLPVESGEGRSRRLVGLLLRADVMRRYRSEILKLS